MISNSVKCDTARLIEHPKSPAVQEPGYTEVIMLFPVIAPPLPTLTAKLFAFMLPIAPEKKSGMFIVSVAFFPTNPVPGLNRICPCCIHMEFGSSPDKKFCVPVSVRSSPVEKVILPSSLLPDIFAKYNPLKLETFPLFTLEKLFLIPCQERLAPIDV